ncbi:MAG TPA: PDZ domain-containing protein [Gemmatimonadales bacterium]|nr:PDZ domain-containing protein [Gemmatimonadales bacterium]
MRRSWLVITVLSAVCATGLTAQEPTPPPAPSPPPGRAPRAPRAPRAFAFAWSDHHGRIGVVVRTDANAESDKIGAKIEGVTPSGPAAKAGLKVGDIITKFAGTSLGGLKAEDEDESGPGRKLIALARKLEPGDTVRLEYRRESETKQATLVAEDLDGRVRVEVPGPAFAMPHVMPDMDFEWSFGEPWGELDLVSLNPDLGEYFGTKEGILVVKAPADSSLPLKGGDVILSIGGRKPTSQSHAMRILRSYEPGEAVSIEIMRKQKHITLSWKVPESREHRMRHELERKEREEESSLRRLLQQSRQHLQQLVRERQNDLQRLLRQQQIEMRRLLRRAPHLQQV